MDIRGHGQILLYLICNMLSPWGQRLLSLTLPLKWMISLSDTN